MMTLDTPVTTMSYSDSFRRKIERAVGVARQKVQADNTLLSEETVGFALNVLLYALELPEVWQCTRHLLMELAPKMEMAGWRNELISILEAGIAHGSVYGDGETVGELHHQLGFIYYLISQYDRAEEHFGTSAEIFAQLGDKYREGRGWIKKASVMRSNHRPVTDIENLVNYSFSLAGENEYLRGYGYLVRGAIAFHVHEAYGEAIEHYQRSLELWQATDDTRSIGWAWVNLGMTLIRVGRFEACIEACLKGLQYLERLNDIGHMAIAYNNIGNAYLMLEQFQNALIWYLKSETIARDTNNLSQLALLYNNYGMAYQGLEEWEKSEEVLLEAVHRYETLNNPKNFADALDNLGMTYYAIQDYRRAFVYYRRAMVEVYKLRGSGAYRSFYRNMVVTHLRETRRHL